MAHAKNEDRSYVVQGAEDYKTNPMSVAPNQDGTGPHLLHLNLSNLKYRFAVWFACLRALSSTNKTDKDYVDMKRYVPVVNVPAVDPVLEVASATFLVAYLELLLATLFYETLSRILNVMARL